MLKLIVFVFLLCTCRSQALEPDFFTRQKVLKQKEKKRLQGASAYTQKRKQQGREKTKQANAYKKIRKQQAREQKKRDSAFAKDFLKPAKDDGARLRLAQKYAKQKRKTKDVSWKTQNLEFGIKVINPKSKDKN